MFLRGGAGRHGCPVNRLGDVRALWSGATGQLRYIEFVASRPRSGAGAWTLAAASQATLSRDADTRSAKSSGRREAVACRRLDISAGSAVAAAAADSDWGELFKMQPLPRRTAPGVAGVVDYGAFPCPGFFSARDAGRVLLFLSLSLKQRGRLSATHSRRDVRPRRRPALGRRGQASHPLCRERCLGSRRMRVWSGPPASAASWRVCSETHKFFGGIAFGWAGGSRPARPWGFPGR